MVKHPPRGYGGNHSRLLFRQGSSADGYVGRERNMPRTSAINIRASGKRKRLRHWASIVALGMGLTILPGCAASDGVPTLTLYINPDDGGQANLA